MYRLLGTTEKSLPLIMETLEFVSVIVSLIQFRKRVKGNVAQIVVIIIIIIIIIIINYYHLFLQDVFFVGHPYSGLRRDYVMCPMFYTNLEGR
jgi:hypothetical protein